MDTVSILVGLAIMLVSLTVHEAAHAWTADRLGDNTARLLGRVSLNPIVHIDPIGTILLPLIAAYSRLPLIGWAKPVPVNLNNLRRGRRDFMVIAAAGPISNLLQAALLAIALRIGVASDAAFEFSRTADVLQLGVWINVLLAFFNLVPIPPLDGGNVLAGLLPDRAAHAFDSLRPFGFFLLYGLMLTGVLSALILPPSAFVMGILLP